MSDSVKYGSGGSVSLVPFLYGVCARDEMPGTILTALLGDLGLTTAAARALIARMRRDGQLAGRRRGRTVDYRMIGEFRRQYDRIRTSDSRQPVPWRGHFHALLFQVPEEHRAFRDALRRHAVFTGYGTMQPGVLISLTDRRSALLDQLPPLPSGARVVSATLGMSTVDAAAAAHRAWDLGALAERYRAHILTLTPETRRDEPLPADGRTLRRWSDLTTTMWRDIGMQPDLSPELLPDDWPGKRLLELLIAMDRRYYPAVRTYVDELFSASSAPATDP
ncbi:PaaX family transcriptional regulator C-terminal domain-containing protein [Fodinicola acaciae]|uniref:PaaX family transcriptional regulator C-terminal domain-containing protein n=1 Tax=Fodinicola acaciae TaxID=2681555 RepID=UPI0013D4D9F2|nr:PaaX family transcriptional regulator C-terminal domain-containing protein [Fodinicola acaciae]